MKWEYEAKWEAAAKQLHTTMKGWREEHPKASFVEIEEALEAELAKLRAELLGDLANVSTTAEGQTEHEDRVVFRRVEGR